VRSIAAVAYAVLALAWVHGDLDPVWDALTDAEAVALFIVVHLIAGVAVGGWEAALLPAVPIAGGVVLELAGFEPPGREPLPAWFLPALYLPLELAAIAGGVTARAQLRRKLAA
jgi:hypothetical protein